MAEIVEHGTMEVVPTNQHIPSNGKVNAALTTGILGTALGGLSLLGNGALMCGRNNHGGWNNGQYWDNGVNEHMYAERKECKDCLDLTRQNYEGRLKQQAELATAFFETWKRDVDNSFGLYKSQRDGDDIIMNKVNEAAFGLYKSQRDGFDINNQKLTDAAFQLYKSQRDGFDINNQKMIDASFKLYKNQRDGFDVMNQKLTDAAFGLYKGYHDADDEIKSKIDEAAFGLYKNQRDGFDIINQKMIDSSFNLYKNQRDTKDEIKGDIGATNQKITDVAFGLYKEQRDNKDKLEHKINALENKIDVMAAVRPYQDALINAKIDKNELMSDYKLSKRTSRMIEGRLVLPNDVISGFPGYNFSVNA